MKSKGMKVLAAVIAGASALTLATAPAYATGNKCRATLSKESAKLTQALAKTIQSCDEAVRAGKATGPCPDSKTASSIAGAKGKLKAAINKACAGAVGHFAIAQCPAADGGTSAGTGGPCTGIKITDNNSISDCLSCLADENASELLSGVVYNKFIPAATKDIGKCQATIGKNTSAFYIAKSKALGTCQAGVIGGKITGPCPDAAAQAAIAKAEDKKVAAITKDCCGPDGVCGGGQCAYGPATVTVVGCTGAGTPDTCCTGVNTGACGDATCTGPGAPLACCTGLGLGNCSNTHCTASKVPFNCCTGAGTGTCAFNTVLDCELNRDCFRCIAGPTIGQQCQSNGQCGAGGRCANGLCNAATANTLCTAAGVPALCCSGAGTGTCGASAMCEKDSDCPSGACDKSGAGAVCAGGSNNGKYCLIDADCLGGICTKPAAPLSFCQSDDLRPVQDIGFADPCPGINVGTGSIGGTVAGQTSDYVITCVDTQAEQRASCQDKAGATFAPGSLSSGALSQCGKAIDDCTSNGGATTATITIVSPAVTQLGGVSVSLGIPYDRVQLPGAGGDAVTQVALQQNAFTSLVQASDSGDNVAIGATPDLGNLESFTPGSPLFVVTFNTCGGAVTAADFPCVVQSASDTSGNALLAGVTCTVTVP